MHGSVLWHCWDLQPKVSGARLEALRSLFKMKIPQIPLGTMESENPRGGGLGILCGELPSTDGSSCSGCWLWVALFYLSSFPPQEFSRPIFFLWPSKDSENYSKHLRVVFI